MKRYFISTLAPGQIDSGGVLVGYLTPDSDLDLAPDPDQFGALPPIRYINLWWGPYKVVLRWLKFDRGGVQQTRKLEPLQKSDNRLYTLIDILPMERVDH